MYYKQVLDIDGIGHIDNVLFDDGEHIWTIGPETRFWAHYLEWLAEGNTPEPWEATNGPE